MLLGRIVGGCGAARRSTVPPRLCHFPHKPLTRPSCSSSDDSHGNPSSSSSRSPPEEPALSQAKFAAYEYNPKAIFIKQLPRSFDALLVADLCKPFGPVADVRVNYFQNSRESRGSATVEFLDSCSAERARESLDGYDEPGWKAPLDVDAGKTRTVEADG